MKKFFFSFVALVMTLTATAQTDKQMATLQHGDQTQVFYGIDAFRSAYEAAADTLDVITLSAGKFYVPDIRKSISVYGAGFEGNYRTELLSGLSISAAKNKDQYGNTSIVSVNNTHLEGICGTTLTLANNYGSLYGLTIVKCSFEDVRINTENHDCQIRQCKIAGRIGGSASTGSSCYSSNLLISNCHIAGSTSLYASAFTAASTIVVDHCILLNKAMLNSNAILYTNNLIENPGTITAGTYRNNISYNMSGTPACDIDGNWTGVHAQDVFTGDYTSGAYAEDRDFSLKEPTKYIGSDGTQIGILGGVYSWNKIPCIPRITECSIDTENAANGTIKLSFKAEAQTKE